MNKRILWSLSATIALAVHAGAVVYYAQSGSKNVPPPPAGQKGVLVELAFEGAAAGGISQAGNTQELSEHQEVAEQTAPKKAKSSQPVPEQPVDVQEDRLEPPEEKIEDIPEPEETKDPEQIPVIEEKPEEQVEEPEPASNPDIIKSVTAPQKQALARVVPSTETVNNAVGEENGSSTPAVTNSVGGAGGSSAEAKGSQGDGNAAQSGGMGGVIRTYEDLVRIWVQKNLIYPRMARERRLMGVVTVRFTLDTTGNVLKAEIAGESKYRILNKSALKTIKKASPFPTFPDEMHSMKERVFLIPIEFGTQ